MNKNTGILLAVFVVLLGVYFLFFRSKDVTSSGGDFQKKLFTADSSKIDKIEITRTNESFTLEKVNNKWMVTKPINYEADTNAVVPIVANLKNFKIDGVASTNPDKFSSYLDSVNHTKVTAYQEGKLLGTFEVGKQAVSFGNSYIKLPDENRILIASDLSSADFTKPFKDYRIKYIGSIPFDGIKTIHLKSTDTNKVDLELRRDSLNTWYLGTDTLEHAMIDVFVNMLGTMNTDDFIDSTITNFPEPTYTITVTGAKPTTINLYKYKADPIYYVLQVSGVKQLFKLSEPIANTWMKKRADLVAIPTKTGVTTPTPKTAPPKTDKTAPIKIAPTIKK